MHVRRRGGLAGNISLGAELDTAALSGADAQRVESALGRLAWGAPAQVTHPDAFRYEISLPESPERGTAVVAEDQMAEDLGPLLDHLQREGVIER